MVTAVMDEGEVTISLFCSTPLLISHKIMLCKVHCLQKMLVGTNLRLRWMGGGGCWDGGGWRWWVLGGGG